MSRTRSQSRLAAMHRNKERQHRLNGKSGFSEEFLDRLDGGGSDGGESGTGGAEPELKWERLRLSDGDLLSATRDPEFEKLKVNLLTINFWSIFLMDKFFHQGSGGADSGLGSDDVPPVQAAGDPSSTDQVVLRRPKKSASSNQRPKSEMFPSRQLNTTPPTGMTSSGASVSNLKPSDSIRRSKRYSAFGGTSPFGRVENYLRLEQLGEGSYATVYRGFSNLTQQVVALKEIRLQEEEGAPFTAIREASLLRDLRHANVVTLHDIVHTKTSLTFVFEYVVSFSFGFSFIFPFLFHFSVWFSALGFGAVSGEEPWRAPGAQRPSLFVPAPPGPLVRPPAQDPPSGLEAAEFAHQPNWRIEIGGFRAGPRPVRPLAHLLLRSGDALVPAARSSFGLHHLLVPIG